MELSISGEIILWRGPAPFHFVVLEEEPSRQIKEIAQRVTYGWGAIPVIATIGETEFKTSLFPKDGRYLLPIKDAVRKAEKLDLGDEVEALLEIFEN